MRYNMKKAIILILILSMSIFIGCVNKTDIKAINVIGNNKTANITKEGIVTVIFALDLYSNLKEKEHGNIFFSPYSIFTALAMVYEGARGETAKEIQSVFHFPEDGAARRSSISAIYNQLNKKDTKYKLDIANALWIQKDYNFLKNYIDIVDQYYGGKAANVDFKKSEETRNK